ncbi:MAG: glycosyltransferase family 1 protein [Hyphomicrobiaceae bacterium]|nr:glycosyltransferase family 1 protein [Hyphomicrobiaceae bacterium]
MRILLVGPGSNRKFGDRFYYSFSRRLLNGFVRNGHFVLHVSDRDLADYALGLRSIGAIYANRRLREIAASLQPDLLVLVHADLVTDETVAAVRKVSPATKVAVAEFDALAVPGGSGSTRLGRMSAVADAAFATTGGQPLAAATGGVPAFFIPNPVDVAMDDRKAYEGTPNADVFFAGQQGGQGRQWQRALSLRAAAPELRYAYHGMAKQNGLWGHAYIAALAACRIGLNLNREEGFCYASDRMAQYLGNGLLLATDRASGYDAYFSDDEMIFFATIEELADACRRAAADDQGWRLRAQRGRDKALVYMSNTIVCEFIARVTLGESPPSNWLFPH